MRLTLEQTLHRIGQMLSERIAPDVQTDFVAQSARLSGGALNICANWVDDAAAIRVEENRTIRAIPSRAAERVTGDLASRLANAGKSADPGLRISELDAENHWLRQLLVEAHGWLEEQAGGDAREIVQDIWALLEDIELKRAPRE